MQLGDFTLTISLNNLMWSYVSQTNDAMYDNCDALIIKGWRLLYSVYTKQISIAVIHENTLLTKLITI